MQYRVVTENAAGEQRTIEFNSRRAAYHQFSSAVTSRYTANASLEKWDAAEHQWQDLADMHISRQAPQPQAADGIEIGNWYEPQPDAARNV